MGWFLALAVGLLLNIVSYLLMPKPKQPKPAEAEDMETPTAEAGRPVPVLTGTMRIKGQNIVLVCDKNKDTYKVKA